MLRIADPNNAAYKLLTDAPSYSAQVKEVIVPNPVSGPGISPSAIDLLFTPTTKPLYPAKTFNRMMNQPLYLTNGMCQFNAHYFNETFAQPSLRTGSVTLYSPAVSKYLVGGTQGGAKQYSVSSFVNTSLSCLHIFYTHETDQSTERWRIQCRERVCTVCRSSLLKLRLGGILDPYSVGAHGSIMQR